MSKPAGRKGDICVGHGAWHPSPITGGSSNVFTNGKPAARQGDSVAPHTKPKSPPHGRSIAGGSSTVFINGKPAARVGDAIACGGNVSIGSGNVFIGDNPVLMSPTNVKMPNIDLDDDTAEAYRPSKPSHTGRRLDASERPKIEELEPEALTEPPIEFKDALVRLDIDPSSSLYANDQFVLKSTDGSVNIIKTVADDQVAGDGFIDLQFDQLDTSKNYTLEQIGSDGHRYTYFEDYGHSSIGIQSPAPVDLDDDETED